MNADLTVERLVAIFADSVQHQAAAIRAADAQASRRHAARYIDAFRRLRGIGDTGRDGLCALLEHQDPDVRTTAAAYLLRYRTDAAMAVLRREAGGDGWAAFGASQVIKRWEEGQWTLDPC